MRIEGIIWLRDVVDKLITKHNVETDEVEAFLKARQRFASLKKANEKARMFILR